MVVLSGCILWCSAVIEKSVVGIRAGAGRGRELQSCALTVSARVCESCTKLALMAKAKVSVGGNGKERT